MPSTNKTSHLGLNKWIGADKPKMSDFNTDNQKVDDAMKAHVENPDLHITAADRARLSVPIFIGNYEGTGTSTRDFTLEFTPALVIVFAGNTPLAEYDSDLGFTQQTMAMASGSFSTMGIELTATGFTVYHTNGVPAAGYSVSRLNLEYTSYCYLAWK